MIAIPVVITISLAVAAGSWALSAEVHNYRLQNISSRLGSHEKEITLGIQERSAISRDMVNFGNLLTEVRDDVKKILQKEK